MAEEVGVKYIPAEYREHNDDEQCQRRQFEDGSDGIYDRRLLNSAQHRQVHYPDDE